ncbi:uncharacterized protein ALTATR162_LOCUS2687 [Alternaria atra]|uniref:Uncharacterized protein n=1 Tax=Alternaria atra TaxID=119953 RepID=A0A8J2N3I8_9PLEO|nr:uncharacterized protein ALTATR162_LOCUS2687 [Alternaria atra]CAG5150518.1 unnamed protein product [Alternaria atra]
MADRRSVRSASRRKSPTPQPPSKATATQLGRASRARSLRSVSREVEDFIDIQKPTRRSARQASVTTNDESEHELQKARKTKRKPAKELLGDLTVVEEMDTHIDLEQDEAPGTPTRTEPEHAPFQSPGAASQMSGTTAISSFSMVEAEFLEPRFILKHLRKLCDSAEEFLEHIAPDGATMRDDLQNIQEMQKPGSAYMEEYLDFNDELNLHLKHFKSEEHSYIHVRALHRALFGTSDDVAASQSGLDLILHLTNLLVLAKQMIHSNRDDKNTWDVLRQLDNTFPAQFMQSLDPDIQPTAAGESALYKDTFDLALELRTQLAILVLQKSADSPSFDAPGTIDEIFFYDESTRDLHADSDIRGWNMPALGGDGSSLPQTFQDQVMRRVDEIWKYLPEHKAVQRADLEELKPAFPWEPTILRLLDWVRLRHRELKTVIDNLGGPIAITRNVKQALEEPQPVVERVLRESLRKKRTSLGRDRRRSSRKFDPNAEVDLRALDVLKAKERDSGVYLGPAARIRQTAEEVQEEQSETEDQQQYERGSVVGNDTASQQNHKGTSQAVEEVQEKQPEINDQEDNSEWQTLIGSEEEHSEKHLEEQQLDQQPVEDMEEVEEPQASGPPQSSAALLKALKDIPKPQKENRPVSIFDRQTTAQRVEFGDGFDDTQPTPGPSNTTKGKQPAGPSPRKRRRPVDSDSDSDSDAFEAEDRGHHAPERRRKAPIAKKQRTTEPLPSFAPPSHQPLPKRKNFHLPPPGATNASSPKKTALSTSLKPEAAAPNAKPAKHGQMKRRKR